MNDWTNVFLGVIAAATLATAILQIAVLISAGMLVKRLMRLADTIERELSPLLASLNSIGRDAARAAALATAATAWPTYKALSRAMQLALRSRKVEALSPASMPTLASAGKSAAVTTALTPGSLSACANCAPGALRWA